jgi:hypothetical protein
MGGRFSRPTSDGRLEAEIRADQSAISRCYQSLKRTRVIVGFTNFLFGVAGLVLVIICIIRGFLLHDQPLASISHSLLHREVLVFFAGLAIWSLITLFCSWSTQSVSEAVELKQIHFSKSLKRYHDETVEILRNLQSAGVPINSEYSQLPTFDTVIPDGKSRGQSLWWRFLEWLMGAGPDTGIAVICPVCAHHNGIVREAEFSTLSYKCSSCHQLISKVQRGQDIVEVFREEEDEPEIDFEAIRAEDAVIDESESKSMPALKLEEHEDSDEDTVAEEAEPD